MTIRITIDRMLVERGGMSVGEFADAIGITPANVAVLKNGRAKPSASRPSTRSVVSSSANPATSSTTRIEKTSLSSTDRFDDMTHEFDLPAFAVQFQKFLDTMSDLAEQPDRDVFESELGTHLGVSPRSLDPVRQEFPRWRWIDVDAALDALSATQTLRGVVPAGDPRRPLRGAVEPVQQLRLGGSVERTALPPGRARSPTWRPTPSDSWRSTASR